MDTNILKDSVVFITGADGGIGTAFIAELLQREVKKIYATGLNFESLEKLANNFSTKVVPLRLDVTNSDEIAVCVKKCNDTTILINNAGIELNSCFLDNKTANNANLEMKINFIGPLDVTNQFIPVLKQNANAAIINILSIASLVLIKNISTYCTSKMAFHVFTQAIRTELENEIKVFGIYPGYVDTKMVTDVEIEKISPSDLVKNICDEIQLNKFNVFPDAMSKNYCESNKLNLDYF
jgi:NADP-dependent 3-hydroxy acid dehydrogenase YdfG